MRGVLFRSGDTAQPNIVQLDSNGDGNATGGRNRPLIEIPAPRPRFGGSLGPHFLEKHEENRGFQVKTGIFLIPLYLRE